MLFFLCYVRILWYSVKEMLNDLFRLGPRHGRNFKCRLICADVIVEIPASHCLAIASHDLT